MKYFIDTKFHEYKKQPKVLGIKVDKPIDTIELISIGIVSEDIQGTIISPKEQQEGIDKYGVKFLNTCDTHKEYYAICKEFDIRAAWNNWQWKDGIVDGVKEYWLRENVLKTLFNQYDIVISSYRHLKLMINKYGKTREQIAEEIKEFINERRKDLKQMLDDVEYNRIHNPKDNKVVLPLNEVKPNMFLPQTEFYAYYADYDWVVFCWLFGRMIDLPKGFLMYCKDLKQELDKKVELTNGYGKVKLRTLSVEEKLEFLKDTEDYPKQTNEHNALAGAKWNKKLYDFINEL